jgi:hypothetical protein
MFIYKNIYLTSITPKKMGIITKLFLLPLMVTKIQTNKLHKTRS